MRALVLAELLKLQRQPSVLFWAFLSVPVAALALKIAFEIALLVRFRELPPGQIDLLTSAAQSLGIAGNPISQLLYAIGVSSVFFTEYRFSTWRNLLPRAGRIAPLVAKCAACLLCTLVGLVLTVVGDAGLNTALAVIAEGADRRSMPQSNGMLLLATAFTVAVLELMTLGLIVAALTIAFRSMIAAIVPVFLLGIGTWLLQAYFGSAISLLPLPSIAADAVRASLFDGANGHLAITGIATLLTWSLAAAGFGTVIFLRQALSTE